MGQDILDFQHLGSWDSTRQTWRLVQGFRGNYGDWDWDAAVVASKATSKMNNHGRANLTLLDAALAQIHT